MYVHTRTSHNEIGGGANYKIVVSRLCPHLICRNVFHMLVSWLFSIEGDYSITFVVISVSMISICDFISVQDATHIWMLTIFLFLWFNILSQFQMTLMVMYNKHIRRLVSVACTYFRMFIVNIL